MEHRPALGARIANLLLLSTHVGEGLNGSLPGNGDEWRRHRPLTSIRLSRRHDYERTLGS
jgi:hypothetical protein